MTETYRGSYRFPASRRLSGRRAFAAVYAARMRKSLGPVTVYGRANDLDHRRLGLSVSAKVGAAARRNRIKRLIREAFRLSQHEGPQGYDIVVVVHRHEPLPLADYQRMLGSAVRSIHATGQRRGAKGQTAEGPTDTAP